MCLLTPRSDRCPMVNPRYADPGTDTDAVVERMKRLEERKRLEEQEARPVIRPNGELRLGNKV